MAPEQPKEALVPSVTPEQDAARARVLEYLGDAAAMTPEEEAAIVALWQDD
jgi:hypothetical protein